MRYIPIVLLLIKFNKAFVAYVLRAEFGLILSEI